MKRNSTYVIYCKLLLHVLQIDAQAAILAALGGMQRLGGALHWAPSCALCACMASSRAQQIFPAGFRAAWTPGGKSIS